MASVLYLQVFFFFITALLLAWANSLKSPMADFARVAAIMAAGLAVSNLLFVGSNYAVGEIVMGVGTLLAFTGIVIGGDAFLTFFIDTISSSGGGGK